MGTTPIFEEEKFSIFLLQKFNQPEKKTSNARLLCAAQNSVCKVPK
jgi:hypothetical protein